MKHLDGERLDLTIMVVLIIVLLICGVSIFAIKSNKNSNSERKFECKIPLKQGDYTINQDGILTSPSGIKITCNKIK